MTSAETAFRNFTYNKNAVLQTSLSSATGQRSTLKKEKNEILSKIYKRKCNKFQDDSKEKDSEEKSTSKGAMCSTDQKKHTSKIPTFKTIPVDPNITDQLVTNGKPKPVTETSVRHYVGKDPRLKSTSNEGKQSYEDKIPKRKSINKENISPRLPSTANPPMPDSKNIQKTRIPRSGTMVVDPNILDLKNKCNTETPPQYSKIEHSMTKSLSRILQASCKDNIPSTKPRFERSELSQNATIKVVNREKSREPGPSTYVLHTKHEQQAIGRSTTQPPSQDPRKISLPEQSEDKDKWDMLEAERYKPDDVFLAIIRKPTKEITILESDNDGAPSQWSSYWLSFLECCKRDRVKRCRENLFRNTKR